MILSRTNGRRRLQTVLAAFSTMVVILSSAIAQPFQDLSDYAFVAGRQSSEVTVISTSNDRIFTRLKLPSVPSQIVISESRRMLIAVHEDDELLSLVDLDIGQTTRSIAPGFRPDRLQIEDKSGIIAVSGSEAGKIAMISLDRGEILFITDVVKAPSDLMFDRTGKRLYVAERKKGTISLLNAENGNLIDRITLQDADDDVVELIRTPGGGTGLALHGESGLISALDLDEGVQVGSSKLPGPAVRGFPSANSQYFLIPNGDNGSMSMVSSWTYQESESLPAPRRLAGINFAMFDTVAFATGSLGREALAISLIDDHDPQSLSLPGKPETGLTVDAGKKIYVALSDTDQVAVIDAATRELTGLIDGIGKEPWAITAAGGLGYCH